MTGRIYRHVRTQGIYTIMALALETECRVPVVVYMGDDGSMWVRPEAEFFDGRFERVS